MPASEDEWIVRENMLDALDRLYDQECRVIDVCALLEVSTIALGASSDLAGVLADAAEMLAVLVRLGKPEAQMNLAALVLTDPLRQAVAATSGWPGQRPQAVRGRRLAVELLRDAASANRQFANDDRSVVFETIAEELSRQ